ncbi:MAG: hypothetical protein ACLFMP_01800 [Desulfonatronovibrionaceae bacterium]
MDLRSPEKKDRSGVGLLLLGVLGSLAIHFFLLSAAAACWTHGENQTRRHAEKDSTERLFLELSEMHKLRRDIARESGEGKDPGVPELAGRAALSDGSGRSSGHRVCVDDPELQARLRNYKAGVMEIWEEMHPGSPGYAIVVFKTDEQGMVEDYYIRDMGGGTDFRLFLLDFLKEVKRTRLTDSGPVAADWFECEFRVRASLAAEK